MLRTFAWTRWRPALGGVVAGALLLGCVVEHHHSDDSGGYAGTLGTTGTGGTPAASAGGPGPSGGPMLVDVDPDQTLTTSPGNGVGVFVEYQSGGHWHVWWTCDTVLSGLSCDFQVDVSVTTGALTNVAGQNLEPSTDQVNQPVPAQAQALTRTSTGVDGMTFDATPGAVLTLDAQVNGNRQINGASFLFFVQKGQTNGGYAGNVSDPLMLQPTAP